MPHILTETATYDASVTVPDDGDAVTAAAFNAAYQALADRTKYLRDKLAAGDVQVHRYASLSAMAGVQPADGTVAVIAGSNASENDYVFDASSSAAALSIYVVVPTGAPTTGRWILASVPILFNAGHDGASARLYTPPANGTILPSDADPGSTFITAPASPIILTNTGSWQIVNDGSDPAWQTNVLSLLVGDIVTVEATFTMDRNTGAYIKAAIGLVGSSAYTTTAVTSEIAGKLPTCLRFRGQIGAAGTYQFGVFSLGPNTTQSAFATPCGLTWDVTRPLHARAHRGRPAGLPDAFAALARRRARSVAAGVARRRARASRGARAGPGAPGRTGEAARRPGATFDVPHPEGVAVRR
jgi:hypothetical protein